LKEVPRRVLKALRIVLVTHMDEVLREALKLSDPDSLFGPRKPLVEYRFGELVEPDEGDGKKPPPGAGDPPPAGEPPPAQPGLSG
jgi:ATP-dependent Lon protease